MVRPNLVHPIQVTVERFNRDGMIMDGDAREPIHGARAAAADVVTLPAQVKWDEKDDPEPQEGGVRSNSSGYILCRFVDLDLYLGAGQRFKRGDRITTMGVTTGLDLYITGNKPMGHYPDQRGAGLIRYNFADRKPKQQRGNL